MATNKLMLITGASAGIGEEFAKQYAALGWDIALTARRADRLEKLARNLEEKYQVATIVVTQDLARANSVDTILKEIKEAGRHVDGVVNNAGYGLPGTFFNTKWKDQAAFLRVLYTAPIELTHKVLPGDGGARLWTDYQCCVACGLHTWFERPHALCQREVWHD